MKSSQTAKAFDTDDLASGRQTPMLLCSRRHEERTVSFVKLATFLTVQTQAIGQ